MDGLGDSLPTFLQSIVGRVDSVLALFNGFNSSFIFQFRPVVIQVFNGTVKVFLRTLDGVYICAPLPLTGSGIEVSDISLILSVLQSRTSFFDCQEFFFKGDLLLLLLSLLTERFDALVQGFQLFISGIPGSFKLLVNGILKLGPQGFLSLLDVLLNLLDVLLGSPPLDRELIDLLLVCANGAHILSLVMECRLDLLHLSNALRCRLPLGLHKL